MHRPSRTTVLATASILASLLTHAAAQTYTNCNPLTQTCPADPALGKSATFDFTSGASDSFTPTGKPTYGPNGAEFTVAKTGDSPLIESNWYIMFGHVDYVIQAAPGVGIVSSAVLQSDDLDEIDWEWVGGDDTHAQTNYFGKGLTTTYNRGTYNAVANTHDEFHTYSVDWTSSQIVWSVDGVTVRVLTAADADPGQYPQTPMVIKVGAWSGGDPANPPGTISWAGGTTDYGDGPFTMYLKSINVADYSTGSSYSYSGTSGTWESIESDGGKVNPSGSDPAAEVSTSTTFSTATSATSNSGLALNAAATAPASPSGSSGIILSSATVEISGSTATSTLATGLSLSTSGKANPSSAASQASLSTFSQFLCSPASSLESALEVVTSFDEQGVRTLITINPAAVEMSSDLSVCSTTTHVQSVLVQTPTGIGTTRVSTSTTHTSSTYLATNTQAVPAAPNGANRKQSFGLVAVGLIGAALIA